MHVRTGGLTNASTMLMLCCCEAQRPSSSLTTNMGPFPVIQELHNWLCVAGDRKRLLSSRKPLPSPCQPLYCTCLHDLPPSVLNPHICVTLLGVWSSPACYVVVVSLLLNQCLGPEVTLEISTVETQRDLLQSSALRSAASSPRW